MITKPWHHWGIVDKLGKVFILELGARSGGCLIPQITKYAMGVEMMPYVSGIRRKQLGFKDVHGKRMMDPIW